MKEKTKVKVTLFNAANLRKKKTAKDKGVVRVQPTWAPNIPKSKCMVPASAASLKRPASLKNKKETKLSEDAEGDAEGNVLDPDLPAKEGASAAKDASECSLKRKAVDPVPSLPRIPRKKSKV